MIEGGCTRGGVITGGGATKGGVVTGTITGRGATIGRVGTGAGDALGGVIAPGWVPEMDDGVNGGGETDGSLPPPQAANATKTTTTNLLAFNIIFSNCLN